MNRIYLSLDRFCATHADFIWDVSPAISEARNNTRLLSQKIAPVVHVPIGVYANQIRVQPASKIIPFSLVYLGTLGEDNGPDLAIEALELVLQKYPLAKLHVVGGGEKNLTRLKALAAKLRIEEHIVFHGFVVSSADMTSILSSCQVGLAPYRSIPGSIRYYADASKLRSYAAAGLAIVTTPVPPLGRELERLGGAIVVQDNQKDFAQGILDLFSNSKRYARIRKQAIKFAKDNTWDNEFTKAFAQSRQKRDL